MFCLQDTLLKYKDTDRLKVKVWKQIRHANSKHKIDTLASINIRLPFTMRATGDKEGHFIMEGSAYWKMSS